jgi:hypothetical protein
MTLEKLISGANDGWRTKYKYQKTDSIKPLEYHAFIQSELTEEQRAQIFEIFERNMRDLYTKSSGFGWNEREKKEELFDAEAHYLMITEGSTVCAYLHFRFVEEEDEEEREIPVAYW